MSRLAKISSVWTTLGIVFLGAYFARHQPVAVDILDWVKNEGVAVFMGYLFSIGIGATVYFARSPAKPSPTVTLDATSKDIRLRVTSRTAAEYAGFVDSVTEVNAGGAERRIEGGYYARWRGEKTRWLRIASQTVPGFLEIARLDGVDGTSGQDRAQVNLFADLGPMMPPSLDTVVRIVLEIVASPELGKPLRFTVEGRPVRPVAGRDPVWQGVSLNRL